jgi:RNA-binding protein Musashi
MRDKTTGRPRGFGFVVFSDPSVLDPVLHDKHTIDGRTVIILPLSLLWGLSCIGFPLIRSLFDLI